MEDEKITQAIKRGLPFELAEDFRSRYANNVFYETSVFDIKLDFGEVMQLPGQDPYIEQHTSITLSWLEAKLAVLFLAVNVATQEKRFGTIPIPEGLIPSYFQKSAEEGKL